MRKRIFHIMQYEKHPTEDRVLLTEQKIIEALSHKSIKKWAYICHDKDVYTEEEERKFGKKQGETKPKHWHIVCRCDNAIEINTLAEWFGIEPQYIDVPRGHGAFLDCVEYLTHESEKQQLKGKTLYSDDEVVSNFDYRTELKNRAEIIEKYGHELSPKEQMRYDVMYEGKTLKQCIEEDKMAYGLFFLPFLQSTQEKRFYNLICLTSKI